MDQLLYRTARVNLERSMHLRPDERFLLVHDGSVSAGIIDTFVAAALSLDAEVTTLRYKPYRHVSMREFGLFAAASLEDDPQRLPETAAGAMAACDATLILNADLELLFDRRFLNLAETGPRITWAPYLDTDSLLRLLPSNAEEVDELYRTSTAVGDAVAAASTVVLEGDNGTSLRMRIGGQRINWSTGVHEAGKGYGGLEIWPGGQISTVPDAGTANGTLVIDRSVNAPEFKEVLDPIIFHVQEGQFTGIEGGVEADRLRRFLDRLDHPAVTNLTELGIGTNARCMAAGYVGPAEDTHTLGCISMALGADIHLGGMTRAPVHLDMTARHLSLALDGTTIVDDGRIAV
jgi:hypothetical protein